MKILVIGAACVALLSACGKSDNTNAAAVSSQMGYELGAANGAKCNAEALIIAKIMINGGPNATPIYPDMDYSSPVVRDMLEKARSLPVSPANAAKQHFDICMETSLQAFTKANKSGQ